MRRAIGTQSLLVEPAALDQAEEECLAKSEARARRLECETVKRAEQDQEYVQQFAARVRELYPQCPRGIEFAIAAHAVYITVIAWGDLPLVCTMLSVDKLDC